MERRPRIHVPCLGPLRGDAGQHLLGLIGAGGERFSHWMPALALATIAASGWLISWATEATSSPMVVSPATRSSSACAALRRSSARCFSVTSITVPTKSPPALGGAQHGGDDAFDVAHLHAGQDNAELDGGALDAGPHRVDRRLEPRLVLGMHAGPEELEARFVFERVEPEDAEQFVGPQDGAVGRFPVPAADLHHGLRRRQHRAAAAQFLLDGLAAGDVGLELRIKPGILQRDGRLRAQNLQKGLAAGAECVRQVGVLQIEHADDLSPLLEGQRQHRARGMGEEGIVTELRRLATSASINVVRVRSTTFTRETGTGTGKADLAHPDMQAARLADRARRRIGRPSRTKVSRPRSAPACCMARVSRRSISWGSTISAERAREPSSMREMSRSASSRGTAGSDWTMPPEPLPSSAALACAPHTS